MNHVAELNAANKALTDFLEVETQDKSRFRFTPEDRIKHVYDVQFTEGKERIFASRVQSIHKCASQDNVDGIMYFVQNRNVPVDKLDDFGNTSLCMAAHHGSSNAIAELCYFHANVDLPSAQKGWTPIHFAANGGHASVVKQLYNFGANTTLKDKGGFTAAHLAAQCNQVEVLKTLFFCQPELPLKNDCLSIRSKTGLTPAHVAAQFDCLEALKFLSRAGCDMEAEDEFKETPAHKAARNNSQSCMKLLDGRIGVAMHGENVETDTPSDLQQQCTRHNMASKLETGPSQVYSQRLVKHIDKNEKSHLFVSNSDPRGKRISYVGTNRWHKTPAEMREEANLKKGIVKEYKPPPPKGPPPKFQQRKDRLSFEFNI
ncbi:hypothetical protein TrST_g4563 [Triparma strigata]|uniref:Uncharacterized protein n=1 Tax=Triparma strigata TaxID=1606541 RepID=A0A9W7B2Z0_9STRA|nr:hypothetical protein TrST_g4563 [Triparma strigata]